MSEKFVREIAAGVVKHPAFTKAIETAVVDVLTATLQKQRAGGEFRLYVPKFGQEQRAERAQAIRAEYNGANCRDLAKKYKISVRQVQRIIKK